jgi:hypothetical protein
MSFHNWYNNMRLLMMMVMLSVTVSCGIFSQKKSRSQTLSSDEACHE